MSENFNFEKIITAVENSAQKYEDSIVSLQQTATAGTTSEEGSENNNELDITKATVATTQVQVFQGISDLAQGIAKSAADHTKNQGRKVGGG